MKLVLIRVGNINPETFTMSAMSTTEFDNVLISAFDWIAQNATRLNIAAVSTSMSHTSFNALGSYCPNRKSSVYPGTLEDRVLKLQNLGIAMGTYQLSFIQMTGQTSPAAAAFATYWVNKYQGNFQETLTNINSLRTDAYFSATKISTKSFIDVLK